MDDLIEVPFEYLEVPVPRNYDAILKRIYGDYMAFPPRKNAAIGMKGF